MSGIGGINQGGYIPPTVGGATTGATSTGATRPGTEIDGTSHAGKGVVGNGNPALTASMRDPGDLDKSLAASASQNLARLSSGDVSADIYTFMALFAKLAQEMRGAAREQRTSEMQAQVSALTSAAEQMKEAAALKFAGAVIQGAMQVAGGMMQVGFSMASAKNSIEGYKAETKVGATPSEVLQGKQMTALGGAQTGYGQAANSMAAGVGTIASASFGYAADLKNAEKTKLETEAKVHETGVQHANDMMQQMMDVIRDVREKLQSIQQAAVETNRGIARNI